MNYLKCSLVTGALIALALTVYLVYALLVPEKF